MDESKFLRIVKSRVARIAVGPSTVRNSGSAGTVAAARNFFLGLDLSPFGTTDEERFRTALDRATERLRRALPVGAQHWGVARKILNIFIRDCFYTTYLANEFHLIEAEKLFELPLDSLTYDQLAKYDKSIKHLPWPRVRGVTPEFNRAAQVAAEDIAREEGIARVHLDALWWSYSRDAQMDSRPDRA